MSGHIPSRAQVGLPDHPRLHAGTCSFETSSRLILRSVRGALSFDKGPLGMGDPLKTLLPRLTGQNALPEVLAGLSAAEAFNALHALDALAKLGVLADGPRAGEGRVSRDDGGCQRALAELGGQRIFLFSDGLLARSLARALGERGADVRHATVDEACAGPATLLVCPDGPDLNAIDAANVKCRESGAAWLFVLPFGDGVLTGPRRQPSASACFRCFERRWLGISPTIELESAYWAALRSGGAASAALETLAEAERLAALVLPLVVARLTHPEASGRVALTYLESSITRESPLRAHPACEVCGPERLTPARAIVGSDWLELPLQLSELTASLEQAAEPPCGLASIVGELAPSLTAEPAPLRVILAHYAFPEPDSVGGRQDNWCHGAAADLREARALAIIEGLERYTGLAQPPPGVRASYAELGDGALLPTELPLFSLAQYAAPGFPFEPFDPERELRWSLGYDLSDQRAIWVPTSAVWYGYDDSLLGECSSGVAAHSSRGAALLGGLLELIERDAFMIHWLHRLSPPQWAASELASDVGRSLVDAVERAGYCVRLLDLTTDLGVPVVLAVGFREDGLGPALRVGAGASLDEQVAALRALSELYSAAVSQTSRWQLSPALEASEVRTLADHSRAYEHPSWLEHAAFLWASNARRESRPAPTSRDLREQLALLVERLGGFGHAVLGVDMTSPDVASHGVYVVRAIAPGLQPLALSAGPRLGGRRLFEAPVRMGRLERPAQEHELNPAPHCFP